MVGAKLMCIESGIDNMGTFTSFSADHMRIHKDEGGIDFDTSITTFYV